MHDVTTIQQARLWVQNRGGDGGKYLLLATDVQKSIHQKKKLFGFEPLRVENLVFFNNNIHIFVLSLIKLTVMSLSTRNVKNIEVLSFFVSFAYEKLVFH